MSENPPPDGDSLPLQTKERIDKICLVFEEAWKSPQRPRIEEYLAEAAGLERSLLLRELLALELDYRRRAAEQPASKEYRERFPDPDDEKLVDNVFHEFPTADSAKPPLVRPLPGAKLRYFGDYELVEEIAHGGMGVVYKARQLSLNRPVALKMILTGQLASEAEVERFQREAEAAANLQHPNIVAIFEVGEHQGQHYFSMEYIEGRSLAEISRENPLPAKRAAQYVKTIAEAIQYAHSQGTLHRDLKPANVLIDPSDQPRITDFGLAKRIEGGSELTGTGQVLGTPSYMPPEQASGKWRTVDRVSDVYALGAILYDLVTARPPFKAETPVDTVMQVLDTEPVSPRRLNPKIPRDLETICLKCLEKEPARRYSSAEALAEDLGRFLLGKPIRARPIGRVQRLWRWCRRNPVVAGLSTTAVLLLAAVAVVATVGYVTTSGALQREARQKGIAQQQTKIARDQTGVAKQALAGEREALHLAQDRQELAEDREQMAREAVDRYFMRVSEDLELKSEGLKELRRDLLDTAREYYEEFVRQNPDDPELQLERGKAYARLAAISFLIDSRQKAVEVSEEGVAVFEDLCRRHPLNAECHYELVRLLNGLHNAYHQLRQRAQSEAALDKARDVLVRFSERLRDTDPEEYDKCQGQYAFNFVNRGVFYNMTGRYVEARAALEKAEELTQQLMKRHTDDTSNRLRLAMVNSSLGVVHARLHDGDAAEASFRKAIDYYLELREESPDARAFQLGLAVAYSNLGGTYGEMGRPDQAVQAYEQGIEVRKALVDQHPAVGQYQQTLAHSYRNLGIAYTDAGRPEDAQKSLAEAIRICEHLMSRYPDNVRYASLAGESYICLGNLLVRHGDANEALKLFEKVAALSNERGGILTKPKYWEDWRDGYVMALSSVGRHEEAVKHLTTLIDSAEGPRRTHYRLQRASSIAGMGDHVRAAGEAEEIARGGELSPLESYRIAGVYSAAAGAAADDTSLDEQQRAELVQRYAKAAVEFLWRVHETGLFDNDQEVQQLMTDPVFAPLRNRDDFRELTDELSSHAAN